MRVPLSHRMARVVFLFFPVEELSNTPVAHKLQYLKGGIAAWLHEAGTAGIHRLSFAAFGRRKARKAAQRRGATRRSHVWQGGQLFEPSTGRSSSVSVGRRWEAVKPQAYPVGWCIAGRGSSPHSSQHEAGARCPKTPQSFWSPYNSMTPKGYECQWRIPNSWLDMPCPESPQVDVDDSKLLRVASTSAPRLRGALRREAGDADRRISDRASACDGRHGELTSDQSLIRASRIRRDPSFLGRGLRGWG